MPQRHFRAEGGSAGAPERHVLQVVVVSAIAASVLLWSHRVPRGNRGGDHVFARPPDGKGISRTLTESNARLSTAASRGGTGAAVIKSLEAKLESSRVEIARLKLDAAAHNDSAADAPTYHSTLAVGRSGGNGGGWQLPPRARAEECPRAVWSRGLAARCCDISQTTTGWHLAAGHEIDDTDWENVKFPKSGTVYVSSCNFPRFLRRFHALPPSARITVVSGQEDAGVPFEIFGFGRKEYRLIYGGGKALLGLLNDTRLVHWFTQNFDGVGCSAIECAPRKDPLYRELAALIRAKMSPMPIGLDFHTAHKGLPSDLCLREDVLLNISRTAPPLAQRSRKLLVTFSCAKWEMKTKKDRKKACEVLKGLGAEFVTVEPREDPVTLWRHMSQYAFVVAPEGHGIDTHRFWEILMLGSIPVVRSDPLDVLHEGLPYVGLARWSDARTTLIGRRDDFIERFATEEHSQTARMLTTGYWTDLIRSVHRRKVAEGG